MALRKQCLLCPRGNAAGLILKRILHPRYKYFGVLNAWSEIHTFLSTPDIVVIGRRSGTAVGDGQGPPVPLPSEHA